MNLKQLMFAARIISSIDKRNHVTYLLALYFKKELSITELTYYMDGMFTSTGKPVTYKSIYGQMYSLAKSGHVEVFSAMSETSGAACNYYKLSPKGEKSIATLVSMIDNWDQWQSIIDSTTNAMFGSKQGAQSLVAQQPTLTQ